MIQNILFEKHHCEDLQSILINYSSHNLHHIFYLFDLDSENDKKKYIYEINKNLLTQLNKIVDTYVISISYSSDENSIALKKLNKYLKEYSIKNSIYSEPFFKELVETSKQGYQYEFEENSIGFFAIEDNLSNKDFISYVKEILKRYPDIKLKLFYFFDFQKIQAQFIFKQELSRIELLIPHNITTIANNVELWFETYDNTINVKKLDDIILNNYENIYSAMFKQSEYQTALNNPNNQEKEEWITDKFKLTKEIRNSFILPNTKYFEFANSLKFDIDKDFLNEKYLKEHVGFFAIKENLQQEFVNKIVEICNKFPNIKFSVFYFDEEDVKEFIKIFGMVINRFNFITPKNIFDITDNIEIWVQAEIKNQSFLHNKIYTLINDTINIHPIILNEEYKIKDSSSNYLENLVENFSETIFTKSLNDNLDEKRLQNTNPEDNIGFLATKDNLEDKDFIKLMTILFEKNYDTRYKAFYFNEEEKELTSTIFGEYIKQIDFLCPLTIYDIVENISIYIYSLINHKKQKTINYQQIWQILNHKKVNLFKIHLFNDIKNKDNFNDSINFFDQSSQIFKNSVISDILKKDKKYNEYNFLNSLKTFNKNKIQLMYRKNVIGFLATEENLQNKEFITYIKDLSSNFPNTKLCGFYFTSNQKIMSEEIFTENNFYSYFPKNIYDIASNIEIYISNPTILNDFEIVSLLAYNCKKLYCASTNIEYKNFKKLTIKEFASLVETSDNKLMSNLNLLELLEPSFKNKIFLQVLQYTISKKFNLGEEELDINSNAYEYLNIKIIEYILKNEKFKEFRHELFLKQMKILNKG